VRDQPVFTALGTPEPQESEVRIPATEESFQHGPHPGVEGAQGVPEALVPEAEEIVEAVPR
jgi:hypothetical protein